MEIMTGMMLPTQKIKASTKSPRKLVIFSKPKVGKTSALANLDNALILDLEGGTDFLDALKVTIKSLEDIKSVGEEIKKAGKPYKYIVVDTITKLEDMCLPLALMLYKATLMGKNFSGDNVLTLPNGAGYSYLRDAFFRMTAYIETLADRVIYVGHLKAKYIEKNGKEVQANELDLTGKMKAMLSADVDAIGLLYRDNNKTIISFKTTDDIICGARPEHLKNQEIVLGEMKDGKLETNWDKIFVD